MNPVLDKEIKFHGYTCVINQARYADGSLALQLVDKNFGDPVAMITTRIDGLEQDELAIKNWSENEGMYTTLLRAGVVRRAHRSVRSGFVTVPVTRLAKEVEDAGSDRD